MHRRRKVDEKSCVTPTGTPNELNVRNKWEENTQAHYTNNGLRKRARAVPFVLQLFRREKPLKLGTNVCLGKSYTVILTNVRRSHDPFDSTDRICQINPPFRRVVAFRRLS